jgi:hypothetical protein
MRTCHRPSRKPDFVACSTVNSEDRVSKRVCILAALLICFLGTEVAAAQMSPTAAQAGIPDLSLSVMVGGGPNELVADSIGAIRRPCLISSRLLRCHGCLPN